MGYFPSHKFCLITAKGDELRVVKAVFNGLFDREDDDGIDSQAVYLVKRRNRQPPLTLLATCCSAMGHVHAATRTAQMIVGYRPSIMFFVGTAASLNSTKVRLGDVIVPTGSVYRIYDKIVEKGETDYETAVRRDGFREHFFTDNALLTDLLVETLPGHAHDLISEIDFRKVAPLENAALADEYATAISRAGGGPRPPKIETDMQMLTCGMVVNSVGYRDFLNGLASRKACAIDMESFGFFRVIADMQRAAAAVTEGIMVRGISDYAGRKEGTELGAADWKTISMSNAAKVAGEMVRQFAEKR